MAELRRRAQAVGTRAATRVLRSLGLRDAVLKWGFAAAAHGAWQRRLAAMTVFRRPRYTNSTPSSTRSSIATAASSSRPEPTMASRGRTPHWLERFRGWRGLLVEPVPELAAEARLSRPAATVIQCALVPAEQSGAKVRMRFGDLFSTVDGARDAGWPALGTALGWRDPYELDVDARTLSSLLDEIAAPEVDLLSLDVEGFEGPALRGLDLQRHAPRYILVEMHDRERDRPPVDDVLVERYLEHSWLSPLDLLYVRRDVVEQTPRV